jgi:hypothetical protein
MRAALLALALAVAGLIGSLVLYTGTPWATGQQDQIVQPVPFDHRHHVADDGIECRYCHSTVERGARAGVPATEVCMGCHGQIWRASPLLNLVRASYYDGQPVPWRQVNHVPEFVYFNHAIHVNKGVGCVTCHGRVDRMAATYQVAPLTMAWCLDCHRHPERFLRPVEHVTDMDWTPDRPQLDLGRELRTRYAVTEREDCTTCHR